MNTRMHQIPEWVLRSLRRLGRWVAIGWLMPLLESGAAFLRRFQPAAPGDDGRPPPEEWKQKALADFSAWLADMPAPPDTQEVSPDGCDLFSMMTEFIALRQEIRLQNREQHSATRAQQAAEQNLQEAGRLVEALSHQVENLRAKLIDEAQKNTLEPFLDVRDALLRGIEAARRTAAQPRRWFRAPQGLEAVAEGYEMALRRFDRALSQAGVTPIETVGRPFDPACMQAVAREEVPGKESGTVLAEQAGGYVRDGRILRTARVVVNP